MITVAAGSTRAQQLMTALIALANVRVKPLGLVLTHVRNSSVGLAKDRSGMTRARSRPGRGPTNAVQWESSERKSKNGHSARHAVDQDGDNKFRR